LDYEVHDEGPNHHLVAFNEEGSNGNKFCDTHWKEFELVMYVGYQNSRHIKA
jgi:hypothetical protein